MLYCRPSGGVVVIMNRKETVPLEQVLEPKFLVNPGLAFQPLHWIGSFQTPYPCLSVASYLSKIKGK